MADPTAFSPLAERLKIQASNVESGGPGIDVGATITESVGVADVVGTQFDKTKTNREALAFQRVLKQGLPMMQEALKAAAESGMDVARIRDPKLYVNSRQDTESWWNQYIAEVDRQTKRSAAQEGFSKIAGGEFEEGAGTLVQERLADPTKAAEFVRRERERVKREKFLAPGGGVKVGETIEPSSVDAGKFVPAPETINDSLKDAGLKKLPPKFKAAFESAASKLGVPESILIAISARESGFNPKIKNPNSSATGFTQLIKSTGKANLAKAIDQGLIPEGTKYEKAVKDPEMNLIMGALEFKANYERFDGDVKKALLAHRIGPGAVDKFLKTGKFLNPQTGKDETDDVNDWVDDISIAAFGKPLVAGRAPLDPVDFEDEASLTAEIKRITGNAKFASSVEGKEVLKQLNKQLDRIRKEKLATNKEAAKGQKLTKKNTDVAQTLDILLGLADGVEPSGFLKGNVKNLLAFFRIDAPTARFNDFKGLLATQISKAIGGESGRLTNQDREMAMRALPGATDSKAIREAKIKIFTRLAENLRNDDLTPEQKANALRNVILEITKEETPGAVIQYKISDLPPDATDDMIKNFLVANGKEPTSDKMEKVRQFLDQKAGKPAASMPAPAVPAPASIPQLAPPAQGTGGIGLGGTGFNPTGAK